MYAPFSERWTGFDISDGSFGIPAAIFELIERTFTDQNIIYYIVQTV